LQATELHNRLLKSGKILKAMAKAVEVGSGVILG
jgi:hypothetical protein